MDKYLCLFALEVFIILIAGCVRTGLAIDGDPDDISRQVTIYRDTYWVPHIFGKTDEACAFGMGYAQAEDNLPQIILSVRQATGTLAEIQGEDHLEQDYSIRLLRIPQFAYENYQRIPSEFRTVVEAYCKGVNYYVERYPERAPQGWRSLVPQDIISIGRYIVMMVFTALPGSAFELIDRYESSSETESGKATPDSEETGSNMWAVSPERSATGKPMLVINPHLPWDGLLQWWEVHLRSEEGWNAMGAAFFGSLFIGVGHNEYLGWSHTVNFPDTWDVYRVELNPENPDQYLYDGKWRGISVVKEDFNVKKGDGIDTITRGLEYTHYGPILRREGDHAYSLKISGWDDVLAPYQWYRMNKARDFREFREAMRLLAVPMFNVVYADRDGNIFYAYNGKVARKNERFDWREVVNGGTTETEWDDYLKFDELPQVLNPKSGFVQNCNTTPFETTAGDDNPRKEDFPSYLTVEGMGSRAQRLRQVLESKDKFSVEDFLEMPWDTWSLMASRTVPYLVEIAEESMGDDPEDHFLEAVEILSEWDLKVTEDAKAIAIFYWWLTLYSEKAEKRYAEPDPMGLGLYRGIGEPNTAIACLKQAASDIHARYGGFPAWGEIHRISHGKVSLPIGGGDGERFGTLASIGSRYNEEDGQFYSTGGHSYVAVVVFTDPPKAWSIFPYGHNHTDPESKHYTDQTELFARFQFKPAWFTEEEIMENLESKYSPSDEAQD